MIVEFFGLPGSGKSTLAAAVTEKLIARGINARLRYEESLDAKSRMRRALHKLGMSAAMLLRRPGLFWRCCKVGVQSKQGNVRDGLKLTQHLVYLYALREFEGPRCDVLILHQGYCQLLYSLAYASEDDPLRMLDRLYPLVDKADIQVRTSAPDSVVVERLSARTQVSSRLEVQMLDASATVEESAMLIDHITERLHAEHATVYEYSYRNSDSLFDVSNAIAERISLARQQRPVDTEARLSLTRPDRQSGSKMLDTLLRNLANTGRTRKQALAMAADATVVVVALWLAWSLRLGTFVDLWQVMSPVWIALPVITVVMFMSFGIYRWVVHSSNRRLFLHLIGASALSALALLLLLFVFREDYILPRSLFILYCVLLAVGACGMRLIWKGLFQTCNQGEPVAIYGAGKTGCQLASLLLAGSDYKPVVFLDDDPQLRHSTVAGLSVLSTQSSDFLTRFQKYDVGRIVMALPSLSVSETTQRIEMLRATGSIVQAVPSLAELITGDFSSSAFRDVSVNDILGREIVAPDYELLGKCVSGKSVLVTGGAGSIGSELCRQIMALSPARLVVVDHCERNLYELTEEIRLLAQAQSGTADCFVPILDSVTQRKRIDVVMRTHRIDTVYHAAAYKHVPIVENQPVKGVEVNVFGTLNVLESAIAHGVAHFVLISTDKAVRPTNAMGATKRLSELVLQAKARESHQTLVSMVRFGNVLDSSGSVVPKFRKQIENGGPITLTHPDTTRFFMTIPEAAQLVLQAGAMATGGEVFVLDMGQPVRIEDLAISMVRLAGKRLRRDTGRQTDIDIVVEGLRPGEKMYEEMFITDDHRLTSHSRIFVANEAWIGWPELARRLAELKRLSIKADPVVLRKWLLDIAAAPKERAAEPNRREVLTTAEIQHVGIDYLEECQSQEHRRPQHAAVS